jgi:3',5'-cyclic AMP phosphodiesterase CpdA
MPAAMGAKGEARAGAGGHHCERKRCLAKEGVGARAKMAAWFHPIELGKTAVRLVSSTLQAQSLDRRALAPVHPERAEVDARHAERPELWLDFAADVGDGFDSTYAVAWAMAHAYELDGSPAPGVVARRLPIESTRGALPRGDVLVLGGDLGYPIGDKETYEKKLLAVYETAMGWAREPHRTVYAIPGNHDWYDGVSAFSDWFCFRRWVGEYRAAQGRTYFALRLPGNWWMAAVDIQLGGEIDPAQLRYFEQIRKKMDEEPGVEHRVLLVVAEPQWLRTATYRRHDGAPTDEPLRMLVDMLGQRVRVFLTGDLHHYMRFSSVHNHKITAGGGGAFLHPTHVWLDRLRQANAHDGRPRDAAGFDVVAEGPAAVDIDGRVYRAPPRRERFEPVIEWPDEATSRELSRWVWASFYRRENWAFALVPATLYLATGWAISPQRPRGPLTYATALESVAESALSPGGIFYFLLLLGAVIAFTETRSLLKRVVGGALHAGLHFSVMVLYGAAILFQTWAHMPEGLLTPAVQSLCLFALGLLVGPLVMGTYLQGALAFDAHSNEAFSALQIQDYKHFVRLCVRASGALDLYVLGIEKVPTKWRPRSGAEGPHLVPEREPEVVLVDHVHLPPP